MPVLTAQPQNDTDPSYDTQVAEALENSHGAISGRLIALSNLARDTREFADAKHAARGAARVAASQLGASAMLVAVANDDGTWHAQVDFVDTTRQSVTLSTPEDVGWIEKLTTIDSTSRLGTARLADTPLMELFHREQSPVALLAKLAPGAHPTGLLGILFADDPALSEDELVFWELIIQIANTALMKQEQQRLQQQRLYFQSMCDSMESLVLVLSPDGEIMDCNLATQTISGFSHAELTSRNVWNAIMLPEETDLLKRALTRLDADSQCERLECYMLTRHGDRRRIAWSFARTSTIDSALSFVGTGVDITERCEAIDRAVRAEAASENARATLSELRSRIETGEINMQDIQNAHGGLPRGVDHERRMRQRREFPYEQTIAAIRGPARPQAEEFKLHRCKDISSRGFAYLSKDLPDYDKVIVAFGTGRSVVHLTADVRHATQKVLDGESLYVVGCRYTGRVTRPQGQ